MQPGQLHVWQIVSEGQRGREEMCVCSRRMWFTDLETAVSPLSHRVDGTVVHVRTACSKTMPHDLQTAEQCDTSCWKLSVSSWKPTEEDAEKVKVSRCYLTCSFCYCRSLKRQEKGQSLFLILVCSWSSKGRCFMADLPIWSSKEKQATSQTQDAQCNLFA